MHTYYGVLRAKFVLVACFLCVLFSIVQESVLVYLSPLFECGTSLEAIKGFLRAYVIWIASS